MSSTKDKLLESRRIVYYAIAGTITFTIIGGWFGYTINQAARDPRWERAKQQSAMFGELKRNWDDGMERSADGVPRQASMTYTDKLNARRQHSLKPVPATPVGMAAGRTGSAAVISDVEHHLPIPAHTDMILPAHVDAVPIASPATGEPIDTGDALIDHPQLLQPAPMPMTRKADALATPHPLFLEPVTSVPTAETTQPPQPAAAPAPQPQLQVEPTASFTEQATALMRKLSAAIKPANTQQTATSNAQTSQAATSQHDDNKHDSQSHKYILVYAAVLLILGAGGSR